MQPRCCIQEFRKVSLSSKCLGSARNTNSVHAVTSACLAPALSSFKLKQIKVVCRALYASC